MQAIIWKKHSALRGKKATQMPLRWSKCEKKSWLLKRSNTPDNLVAFLGVQKMRSGLGTITASLLSRHGIHLNKNTFGVDTENSFFSLNRVSLSQVSSRKQYGGIGRKFVVHFLQRFLQVFAEFLRAKHPRGREALLSRSSYLGLL